MKPFIRTSSALAPVRRLAAVGLATFLLALARDAATQATEVGFCFNAWPPYAYVEDGKAGGLSVEVLREASRRSGLTAVFHELPWKRCLHLVRTGELDAVIDASDRPEFLQGPATYNVYTNTFWVREDDAMQAFDLDAFKGKTVGLVSGYNYPDELAIDPPYRIDYSVDDAMNLRKLTGGRVDAIVADMVVTLQLRREQGLPIRPIAPSHSVDNLYPSFNPGRKPLQRRIDAALAEMIDDGSIDRAYGARLGVDYSEVVLGVAR